MVEKITKEDLAPLNFSRSFWAIIGLTFFWVGLLIFCFAAYNFFTQPEEFRTLLLFVSSGTCFLGGSFCAQYRPPPTYSYVTMQKEE